MRKPLTFIAIFAAAVIGMAAGQWFTASPAAAPVTIETPTGAEMASASDMLIVDIREPDEWKQTGVVQGALLHSYRDPASFLAAVTPHLRDGQKIGVICRSGNRSNRAVQALSTTTDIPVIDIGGGMNRVLSEGYRPVAPTAAQGCATC